MERVGVSTHSGTLSPEATILIEAAASIGELSQTTDQTLWSSKWMDLQSQITSKGKAGI